MNNIKKLTNVYISELAKTDIDSKTFAEIDSLLREKIDSSSIRNADHTPEDRVKAVLIDKLADILGVDKISIKDDTGFQLGGLDLRANGIGPATILIVKEEA